MTRTKKVYLAADDSTHETVEAARAHDTTIRLAPLANLTTAEIVAGLYATSNSIRAAIAHAHNLAQAHRKENGLVRRRPRAGDRAPKPELAQAASQQ